MTTVVFSCRHQYQFKMKRSYTPSSWIRIAEHLTQELWENVLQAHDVDVKVTGLHVHKTVNAILDSVCPVKRVRVCDDDPSWETPLSRKL